MLHASWPPAEAGRRMVMLMPTYHGFASCINAREDMGRLREEGGLAPTALFLTSYHVELATRMLGIADLYQAATKVEVHPHRWAWDTNMFQAMVGKAGNPAGLTKIIKKWRESLPQGWLSIRLPVNVKDGHWIALEVDRSRRRLCILDSLGEAAPPLPAPHMAVLTEMLAQLPACTNKAAWDHEEPGPRLRTQFNGHDCGLHTAMRCAYVDPLEINDRACLAIRRWMVWAHVAFSAVFRIAGLFHRKFVTRVTSTAGPFGTIRIDAANTRIGPSCRI